LQIFVSASFDSEHVARLSVYKICELLEKAMGLIT